MTPCFLFKSPLKIPTKEKLNKYERFEIFTFLTLDHILKHASKLNKNDRNSLIIQSDKTFCSKRTLKIPSNIYFSMLDTKELDRNLQFSNSIEFNQVINFTLINSTFMSVLEVFFKILAASINKPMLIQDT